MGRKRGWKAASGIILKPKHILLINLATPLLYLSGVFVGMAEGRSSTGVL
jgi:hypothetical protein